jgi:predicted 3-demethylubiquinone-9 3-methyltransferase (glyoxalase superfamily)
MSVTIAPFLWFDTHTEAAMEFYTSVFRDSSVTTVQRYPEGPLHGPMAGMEGKVLTAIFRLSGEEFLALDGGPHFRFNPSISFFVHCGDEAEFDRIWARLSQGGQVLMPVDAYPFNPKFGWCADVNGVNWQVGLGAHYQQIVPFLMFVGAQHGKAEEAMRLYTRVFSEAGRDDSGIERIARYGDDGVPGDAHTHGTVFHAEFRLAGRSFMASDSAEAHAFDFTQAVSLYVECDTQAEIDHFWNALSANPDAEQCGWLTDRFGVPWQIVPSAMRRWMDDPDSDRQARLMQAVLAMKKFDIAGLERAYHGT